MKTARQMPPSFMLRLAVVVGCTTLVVGLAGAIVIVLNRPRVQAADPAPLALPPDFSAGLTSIDGLLVFARWTGADGVEVEAPASLAAGVPGWIFPGVPTDRSVIVGVREVVEGVPGREIYKRIMSLPADGRPIALP